MTDAPRHSANFTRFASSGLPLEPSAEQLEALVRAALDLAQAHVASQGDAPLSDVEGAAQEALALLRSPPREGGAIGPLLEVVRRGAQRALNPTSPGYLAYIPGGGLVTAAVADLTADVLNRYVGMAALAPHWVAMEQSVVRWMCEVVGFGAGARGVLTTGGSMANLGGVVCARHAGLGQDLRRGVIYVSDQVHASVTKAARVAGLGRGAVRVVPCGADLAMDPRALRWMVREDRQAGRRPFCVVATAGTTNTGAVDPLGELADLCEGEGLWLHVDAAYGGFFLLTARGRARFAGIERADSVTLDPHKGMFLPYGTGALVVRRGEVLRAAHTSDAAYLQDLASGGELWNFSDHSPELSRDFRGLRVWLPLHLHGVDAFSRALDEKLDLAEHLHQALRPSPHLELLGPPALSVVSFRARPPAGADPDAAGRELLGRINASGRVLLSSTVVRGRFVIRPCILCLRTHRDRIDEAAAIILREAAAVCGAGTPTGG